MISLRPATEHDARALFDWRNDPVTCAASLTPEPVEWSDHLRWLAAVMADPNRQLIIAERNGEMIGTVRGDLRNGVTELSWTLAPAARGKGLAREMVKQFRDSIGGPVCARVRSDNVPSKRIAEHLGLEPTEVENGVVLYCQPE